MAPRWRVLVTDRAWPDLAIEREILEPLGVDLHDAPGITEAILSESAAEADAIICNWAPVTARVVESAVRCRVICRSGIGLDNIAIPTASQRGIPVTNVPDYCVGEVADHTLALLLACARRVGFFHLRTKQGEYRLQAAPPPERLAGKTLGLVGLGRIGAAVAQRARAFGMTILGHTSSRRDHGVGCPVVPLPELLQQSDYVSLHLPATAATRHLFSQTQFEQMRSHAWLLNTSRGALVDEAALWQALQQNRLAGAALDVFDPEPPDLSQPLFRDERVVVTPHAAFVSPESLVELRTRVARQVAAVLRGERPENVVNPQVFST
ncbi:MAG TPA: C-terminal binding protein [Planctomycetaceae bacterium]|nr:C-terminal binding protein [Planctomycetaceae bacterium]